jgi:defect-in-organelle-trafficking protein DotC
MIGRTLKSALLCVALSLPAATGHAQQVGAPLDLSELTSGATYDPRNPPQELVDLSVGRDERGEAVSLSQLSNPNSDFYRRTRVFQVDGARKQVIEAAARGVGIRGGFAYEAERINKVLMAGRYRSALDRHYPFRNLMLQQGYVVPPVITKVSNVREQSGPNFLYLTNGSYEITREPRLVTITPSWMDYLLLPIRSIRPPENIQLKGADEQAVWKAAVEDAWNTGVREARASFTTSLATLHRDYHGMRMYHSLAQQGALSVPQIDVSSVRWRVTEDGKRAFDGETRIEIKVGPSFRRR